MKLFGHLVCLLLIFSCGRDISTRGTSPATLRIFTVTTTGVDECKTVDVSAFQGCTIARFQMGSGGAFPYNNTIMPCDACTTCPFGTSLNSTTDCGCSTLGFIHSTNVEFPTESAFPQGVIPSGTGHIITDNNLSLL